MRHVDFQLHTADGQRAYTTHRAAELSGLTYRRLDYAVRVGRATPSVAQGAGPGRLRLFSSSDVVKLRVIGMLSPDGYTPRWIDRVTGVFDAVEVADLTEAVLVIEGKKARLMTFEEFAEIQPVLRGVVRVVPCDQLLRGLDV